jgi:hypothetical protein
VAMMQEVAWCGPWSPAALKPFRGPELLTIKVLMDHLVLSIPEIMAGEWHAHDNAEHQLSLREFDLALVGAIWGADLTQVCNEPIKGTGTIRLRDRWLERKDREELLAPHAGETEPF